jgi:hypothetical protein
MGSHTPEAGPPPVDAGDASVTVPANDAGNDVGARVIADALDDQRLGQIGEVCQTTRDCAAGLGCVLSSGAGSVCDLLSYGLMPSGKTCSGECSTAADCCSLPTGLGLGGVNDAGVYITVNNCQDILSALLGGSTAGCSTNPPTSPTACFYYQTYCNCSNSMWACNGGRCLYSASCQQTVADTLGGCPSFTRTRSVLNTTCDMPAGRCHSGANGCAAASDCEGVGVSDEPGVTCRGGDCACYMGACFLKCAKDLDCQNGYSCDLTKSLCAPSQCSSDAQCFSRLGKASAICKAGTCGIPCTVDHDCSPSGDLPGQPFNGTVCGPDGICTPVGCVSDSDCSGVGSVRLFCATPVVSDVHSAITN